MNWFQRLALWFAVTISDLISVIDPPDYDDLA